MILMAAPLSGGIQLPAITFLGQTTAASSSWSIPRPGLVVVVEDWDGENPIAPTLNGATMTFVAGNTTNTPNMWQTEIGTPGTVNVNGNFTIMSVYLIEHLISTSPVGTRTAPWGNAATPSTTQTIPTSAQGVAIAANKAFGASVSGFSGLTALNVEDQSGTGFACGYLLPTPGGSPSFTVNTNVGPNGGATFFGAAWR